MKLSELLIAEKKNLLNAWFEKVLGSYPEQTGKFLRTKKNPFSNPVGNTIEKDLGIVYDLLVEGLDKPVEAPVLESVVQIRAVQDFTPARALSFIFELKDAFREVMGEQRLKELPPSDLYALDRKIDEIALVSFNFYTAYRDRIADIRTREMQTRSARLLQRAGLLAELEDDKVDPQGKDVNSLN